MVSLPGPPMTWVAPLVAARLSPPAAEGDPDDAVTCDTPPADDGVQPRMSSACRSTLDRVPAEPAPPGPNASPTVRSQSARSNPSSWPAALTELWNCSVLTWAPSTPKKV